MPSLKNTKRRIVSVKNTQKITRAMKLVSSAKFARANQNLHKAKPYGEAFMGLLHHFLATFRQEDLESLLRVSKEKKSLLVFLTTDRGLCGGLNSNLGRLCLNFLKEKKASDISVDLVLWGKKAAQLMKNRGERVVSKELKAFERPSLVWARERAKDIFSLFSAGEYDRVYIIFPAFKNVMAQIPVIREILPLCSLSKDADKGSLFLKSPGRTTEVAPPHSLSFLEPGRDELAKQLLLDALTSIIFRILLESSASEHAARMSAMDSATHNADKVIKKLTLEYNRGRQAAITKELIEITSGAESL